VPEYHVVVLHTERPFSGDLRWTYDGDEPEQRQIIAITSGQALLEVRVMSVDPERRWITAEELSERE
jgi:hypothetical protein